MRTLTEQLADQVAELEEKVEDLKSTIGDLECELDKYKVLADVLKRVKTKFTDEGLGFYCLLRFRLGDGEVYNHSLTIDSSVDLSAIEYKVIDELLEVSDDEK